MDKHIVAAEYRADRVAGAQVAPGASVAIDACMTPADQDMAAIAGRVLQILGPDQRRPVVNIAPDRHDDAAVQAVGFDEQFDAVVGALPALVDRQQASAERGQQIEGDDRAQRKCAPFQYFKRCSCH